MLSFHSLIDCFDGLMYLFKSTHLADVDLTRRRAGLIRPVGKIEIRFDRQRRGFHATVARGFHRNPELARHPDLTEDIADQFRLAFYNDRRYLLVNGIHCWMVRIAHIARA